MHRTTIIVIAANAAEYPMPVPTEADAGVATAYTGKEIEGRMTPNYPMTRVLLSILKVKYIGDIYIDQRENQYHYQVDVTLPINDEKVCRIGKLSLSLPAWGKVFYDFNIVELLAFSRANSLRPFRHRADAVLKPRRLPVAKDAANFRVV